MSFKESLSGGHFPIVLEITPPQRPNSRLLLQRSKFLDGIVDSVNIVQRDGRQPSFEAAQDLQASGIDSIWNLTVGNHGLAQIKELLTQSREAGLDQILIVKGDTNATGVSVLNAAEMAREFGLHIGAAFNPYAFEKSKEVALAKAKAAAGVGYFVTQPILNLERALPQIETIQDAGVAVIAMVIPLTSPDLARQISHRLKIYLPESYIQSCNAETCWDRFTQLVGKLKESANGIMIMTYKANPDPQTGERITQSIKATGTI